ncbi:hypothetical protein BTM25_00190 [Actinomadura rubteroloni]|uniref:Uncharacterized protein n=1 Tax=Actinomadura rubteroloni TaxID=1926885 RepID=A0A2P4UKS7_9ACTN|nr:hypothetical protein [Actinomadura rubteroloni]POM25638.1 hypothetical protein BTM25_00190 [Actinomadura rubteroloni]
MEWFAHLAEAPAEHRDNVLKAAYQRPLTPRALEALWPGGPGIGGTPAP